MSAVTFKLTMNISWIFPNSLRKKLKNTDYQWSGLHFALLDFLHRSSKFFMLHSNNGFPSLRLTTLCCSHNHMHKSVRDFVLSYGCHHQLDVRHELSCKYKERSYSRRWRFLDILLKIMSAPSTWIEVC